MCRIKDPEGIGLSLQAWPWPCDAFSKLPLADYSIDEDIQMIIGVCI